MNIYYNTTNEKGDTLKKSRIKARTQKAKILEYFQDQPRAAMTPYDIWYNIFAHNSVTPITSIRRAMTDLTKDGYLVKTVKMREGGYGKLNYCYILN